MLQRGLVKFRVDVSNMGVVSSKFHGVMAGSAKFYSKDLCRIILKIF